MLLLKNIRLNELFMKRFILVIPFLILLFTSFHLPLQNTLKKDKPRISITFDDGNPSDMPGYRWNEWNQMILGHLKDNKVHAAFFALGKTLNNAKGKEILASWNNNGHLICNHTYSHISYNNEDITFDKYAADFLKNDSIISRYSGYSKLFRFPYLKEGNTVEKRDQFRRFLSRQQYKNGYVTIDASDWAVNTRLVNRLKKNPAADLNPYKQFYLAHLLERALYYNGLSQKLTGRQVSHTLLLHHNLCSALFLGDLIEMFKKEGWEVINADEAFKDEIYTHLPEIIPAGESLIWAMAKEKGTFENLLRYPAEDAKYENPGMDKAGL
jgi:peptidoglycan/xylan/chitin deacetylase (PgdA/CDA1 family)